MPHAFSSSIGAESAAIFGDLDVIGTIIASGVDITRLTNDHDKLARRATLATYHYHLWALIMLTMVLLEVS